MKHGLCIFLAAVLILSGLSSCGIFKGREEGAEVIRTSRETDEQTSPETETTQEETTPEETETEPLTERSSEESSTEETTEAETTEEESSEEPTEEESTDPDDNSESTSDAGEYSRALAKKNQEFNSEDAEITDIQIEPGEEKPWTVMVYMIGSNLESALGAASNDMEEMAASGLDFSRTNLILYTGGSTRWTTNIPCDKNCVIDMSLGTDQRVVASTEKNADMGAKETLTGFVNFCTEYFPAEHYMLVMWDHGGGPLWGYGSDELYNGDGLLLSEMDLAMSETKFSGADNLDLVGFDACLMGCLENMTIWSKFADYYVGSEEVEPGDGWDYHWLSILNDSDDPVEIGGAIVDCYRDYYEAKRNEYYDPDVTISVADLSAISMMQRALGNAASAMLESVNKGGVAGLAAIRNDSKSFGLTGKAEEGTLYAFDLVDLGDFTDRLSELDADKSEALLRRLGELIVHNYSNVENACGVTLYYPSGNRSQFYEMQNTYKELGLNGEYYTLLERISKLWQNAERRDWTIPAPEIRDGEYTIELTEEQQENIVKASYTILCRVGDGEFIPALENCTADVDKEGVMHFALDPELVVLQSGENSRLWPMEEAERSKRRVLYQTRRTRLLSSGISYFTRLVCEATDISIVLQEDRKSGTLSIRTINSASGDADSGGKETIDVSHYDSIFYYFQWLIPTWNADGELLPLSEWSDGELTGSQMENLEDSFGFSIVHASELSEDLYYLVTIEDENGERYVADPVKIEPEGKCGTVSVRTEKGEMDFLLYDDHAVLTNYSGSDEEVEVPDSAEGLPVTELGIGAFGKLIMYSENSYTPVKSVILPDTVEKIGSTAFYACKDLAEIRLPANLQQIGSRAFGGCKALTQLQIPETVTEIGAYAFSESGLLSISLPAGLTYLGRGAFACSNDLLEIILPEENEAYAMKDGVLYSADYTLAHSCPAAMEGSVELAPECVRILSDCFACSRLSEVILPEGLAEIGNYAFYFTKNLAVPAFPESLHTIGKYAFSSAWVSSNLSEAPKEQQIIRIGKNLRYIGQEAFTGFTHRAFEVDPENPWYSSQDGALLSKAGDSMIEFAANPLKVYVIPDGVKDFDIAIMEQIGENNRFDNDYPYEIYLPDSLIRITGSSMFSDDMIFHCSEGSFAEEYATREGITVSYDVEPVIGERDVSTEQGTMHFILTPTHAALYSYVGEDEIVTVPAGVEGLPVTVIGSGLDSIIDVSSGASVPEMVLPDTVEVLSAHAFEFFGMFNVNLPDSIRVIGDRALYSCFTEITALPKNLEELGAESLGYGCSFPDGCVLPASIQWIRPAAFSGIAVSEFILEDENSENYRIIDGKLYSSDGTILVASNMPDEDGHLTIPEGTVYIGTSALMGLPLTSITIPGSVKLISQYAFAYCSTLEEVVFEEGIENIGSYAFMYTGIRELKLPQSVDRIGIAAFAQCSNLTAAETDAAMIETYAFAYCTKLRDLTLLSGVTEIGEAAFLETGITTVTLPESLYILGTNVFANTDFSVRDGETTEIAIGKNLTMIGYNAFGGLPVTGFTVDPENPVYSDLDGMITDKAQKVLVQVPAGREGEVMVPDGIYSIGAYAFYNCERITDIWIPDSVLVITSLAFNSYSDDDPENAREKITIHCSKGSAAENYAIENNWPCVIDE